MRAFKEETMADKEVKTVEDLTDLLIRVRKAQKEYSEYSQEQVDKIFKAVALASDKVALKLAQDAVIETGIGNVEDKVIKNKYASEFIYSEYKNVKTAGIIEKTDSYLKVAEPLGVLAAVIPTTNPTSTAIFKILLALKTRNGLIFSPHPRAKKCTIEAIKVCYEAALKAGAPKDIIGWIDEPSIDTSKLLMKECDCTLATGGPGMVISAYSSGKPAIGVGPGNAPVVIDSTADLDAAAASIIHSKSFDNGTICASEQNCIVVKSVYDEFKKSLAYHGAYFIPAEDMDKVRKVIMVPSRNNPNVCSVNPSIVGKTAYEIAKISGIECPETTRILVGEIPAFDYAEGFAHEKLSPVLSLIPAESFEKAVEIAEDVVEHGGHGHTADLYVNPNQTKKIDYFAEKIETCRILINMPSAQGGIGGIYTDAIPASLTLGCGSWGGNSTWQNVGVSNLLNIKTVAIRTDSPAILVTPRVEVGDNALKTCVRLAAKNHKIKKIAVVFNEASKVEANKVKNRFVKAGFKAIDCFLGEELSRAAVAKCAKAVNAQGGNLIIAVGGNKVISFAKLIRVLANNPKADFEDLSMSVIASSKRIVEFPENNYHLMVIPTSIYADLAFKNVAIYEEKKNINTLNDATLIPTVVCLDKKLLGHDDEEKIKTFYSLGNAISSYISINANSMTDDLSMKAIKAAKSLFGKKFTSSKALELTMYASEAVANTNGGLFESLSSAISETYHVDIKAAGNLVLGHVLQLFDTDSIISKMGTNCNYVKPVGKKKLADIAIKLGLEIEDESDSVKALKDWLDTLRVQLHLPSTFADLGVTPVRVKKLANSAAVLAFEKSGTSASPIYPRIDGLEKFILGL